MKRWLILMLVCLPELVWGQVITTFAGNGTPANSGDGGQAVLASINFPTGSVFDTQGNFYFGVGAGNRVKKLIQLVLCLR